MSLEAKLVVLGTQGGFGLASSLDACACAHPNVGKRGGRALKLCAVIMDS